MCETLTPPSDVGENRFLRAVLVDRASTSRQRQTVLKERCRADISFYINWFVWTYDPRKREKIVPFVTWDFQEQALRAILEAIRDGRDLVIEKSRDMGMSWLCLIVMDWCCLFHPGFKFLCVSHAEYAVDRKADPDSLFWKLGFMHKYLPPWLVETPRKAKMRFAYPGTGSSITGQATTGRVGVGGRATAVFLDEFGQMEPHARAIAAATADTADCRIFTSAHYGVGTAFLDKCRQPDVRKLVLHWSLHPHKNPGLYRHDAASNRAVPLEQRFPYPDGFRFVEDGSPTGGPFPGLRSPWYDAECQRRGSSRDVASQLDINPAGSVSQFFDPLTVRARADEWCCEPYWQGELSYDRTSGLPLAFMPLAGGLLKLWCIPPAANRAPPGTYGAGADVSAGTGATPSCLSIINAVTGEKVCEYANAHIDPGDFAVLAVALCRLFRDADSNEARLAWEHTGPGVAFGKRVLDLGFRTVYYRTDEFNLTATRSDTAGWVPSPAGKEVLLREYREAIWDRRVTNRSRQALEECLAFQYTPAGYVEHGAEASTGDPSGARVNHGDRVIADALAWKMALALGGGKVKLPQEQEAPAWHPGTLAGRRALHERAERARGAWL